MRDTLKIGSLIVLVIAISVIFGHFHPVGTSEKVTASEINVRLMGMSSRVPTNSTIRVYCIEGYQYVGTTHNGGLNQMRENVQGVSLNIECS